MLRKSAWQRLGGYRADDDLVYGWEDWDLWLRLAADGGRAMLVTQILGRYRVQQGSMIALTNLATDDAIAAIRQRYPTLPWPAARACRAGGTVSEMATSSSPNRAASRETSAAAIDRIVELLGSDEAETVNTSTRIPSALRDAASIAVNDLDVAPLTTALTTDALRAMLEAFVMQAVLDEHYREHPHARPSLADLAIATSELTV